MAWTYQSPFSGFNAWANYNTPEENKGFNYTMDPYYNTTADQQRWDLAQTGANSETNRARVWRWTLDNLRAQGYDPGKAPTDLVNQAYLQNIGRLHQDYQANGFDWNRSGFAGYDKFLATPPGSGPGGPIPVTPDGQPLPKMPAAPLPDQTTPKTAPANTNPGLTGSQPGTGAAGGANGGLSGAGADILSSDPNLAYQYMLRQVGMDPTLPSRFGSYLQKRFSPLLQARLAASNVGDNSNYMGNLGGTIGGFGADLFRQGGDFFGDQRALAEQVLGSQNTGDFLGGISDQQQVEQYLNQLMTLKYAGANPMVQQSIADTLQRGQDLYDWDALNQVNSGQGQGDPYLEWLRKNPAYNRYLGVR